MKVSIKPADKSHTAECVKILQNSELGEAYFSDDEKATGVIDEAIAANELYVAVRETGECLGFAYYKSQGMLGSYPYLHIVAVKNGYRSQGIGRKLIGYFEDNASRYAITKYFLTVDDFNCRAKRLYEELGYRCVGFLPDFYRQGISCYLMMKSD